MVQSVNRNVLISLREMKILTRSVRSTLTGPWEVSFDPKWGGPEKTVTFDNLSDWSRRAETGILSHCPRPGPVHQRVDPAGVRVLPRLADVALHGLGHVALAVHREGRGADSMMHQNLLGDQLVHRYTGRQHAAASIRDLQQFQKSLYGAVLAETPVQGDKDHFGRQITQTRRQIVTGIEADGGDVGAFVDKVNRVVGPNDGTPPAQFDGQTHLLDGVREGVTQVEQRALAALALVIACWLTRPGRPPGPGPSAR